MAKCRRLVGSFKHSDILTRNLKEKQITLDCVHRTKLVQDVPTRWNTSYDMMNSILLNKNALISMSLDRENATIKNNIPTETEFNLMEDLCKILEPLKDLTEFLSGFKYITSTILHPAIYTLTKYSLQAIDINDDNIKEMREELVDIIKKRFNYVLNENSNDLFIMSTFLDFNYRKFSYIKDDVERQMTLERAKFLIIEFAKEYLVDENNNQENSTVLSDIGNRTQNSNRRTVYNRRTSKKKNSFLNNLQDQSNENDNSHPVRYEIEKELHTYLNMIVNLNQDIENKYNSLSIFNANTHNLPCLRKISRIFFTVTASSVPAESLFSYAGLVQNESRNRLDPSTLDMINFFKNNYY